jgi:hypothetical protein
VWFPIAIIIGSLLLIASIGYLVVVPLRKQKEDAEVAFLSPDARYAKQKLIH